MFIRKNKNRSGTTSIQVVQKVGRKNKVLKTIGVSSHPIEIEEFVNQGRLFIELQKGRLPLFSSPEDAIIEQFVATLSNDDLRIVGPKIILVRIYNFIGYDKIDPKGFFRHLVTCRITYPGSKLRTIQYMKRHYKVDLSAQTIYRYLDHLDESMKREVELITYQYVKDLLGDNLGIVFYDMTSLYFETESQDDLRKIGYSKDGKHQHPQIMLGLLVGAGGIPISYEVFEGNTSESKTLIPLLELMVERFNIERPIVVADSALLSKTNLIALQENQYQYILGGRIKNETEAMKQTILSRSISEGRPSKITHSFGNLVVSYSAKRAAKDLYNRTKGLKRLESKIKAGKLTKESINNRGYNKYLVLEGQTKVLIDYEKFKQDSVWDGLKGYITNTTLSETEVIGNYQNLWQVEKAFRMSKTDLRFRPIYHYNVNRIKAHLLICFTALSVYRRLEHLLYKNQVGISVEKAIKELKEIQQLTYRLPSSGKIVEHLLNLNEDQKTLINLVQ
ncbi:MAG: IS1634 family transposase [Bacteroidota bacterium]